MPKMTSNEANKLFMTAICKPKKQPMTSPAKRRAEIAAAKIEALEAAKESIRRRARETPAWAHGYNSAITAIEIEIQQIEKNQ